MKKFISILISAVIILSIFAACNANDAGSNNGNGGAGGAGGIFSGWRCGGSHGEGQRAEFGAAAGAQGSGGNAF